MSITIDKISEFQKFGSILGLERMKELLKRLGNPQDELKIIHVAGTNGKGSTCRYIYCTLQAAGYKTGLFISPFIEIFNERIEVGGKYISDEELTEYTERVLEKVKEMTTEGYQSPTEFEVITAIALLFYKEQACDYVVLEVGLGGKGDSTNVSKSPLATVITSISFDHTDRLGNTIEEIAADKAGIIKEGCPVITSALNENALAVIKNTAMEKNCEYIETRFFESQIAEESLNGYKFSLTTNKKTYEALEISMTGAHQLKNAAAAIKTIEVLQEKGLKISEDALREGLKTAKQPGRMELMSKADAQPVIVIDGAHNEDGAKALADAVRKFCPDKKILFVTGILADKDVDGVLGHFASVSKNFIATEPDNPRKLAAEDLAAELVKHGVHAEAEPDYIKACEKALEKGTEYDVIVFAGSLYLIGAIRGELRKKA